jgi:phosphohistidine swiveling domain-containing protein
MSTKYRFHYNPLTGEYNDSLIDDCIWSSNNTREASPDVMTPYTWSKFRSGFADMILLPGYLQVGNICGRLYHNASVDATVYQALRQRDSVNSSSKELFGIDPEELDKWNTPLIPITLRDRALVLRNGLRFMAKVRKSMKSIQAFLDTNPAWCENQHHILPVLGKDELVRWSNEIYHPYATHCSWWVAGPAFIQANFIGKLRRELLNIVSPDDIIALLSNVSTEDEFLSSLGIVVGLDRLRRGKITRDEYVKKYGHRGPHEVERYFPRPAENPNWIDEQLDGLERTPADVETLIQEQRARYETALGNLQKAAPRKFDSFLQRIKEAARLTRLREDGRAERVRTWWIERVFVLRAGALGGLGKEVFFLEHDEIIRLLGGQDEATSQIPARKNAYQKFSALPEYPTIIVGRFDPFKWATDPNRRTDIYDANHRIRRRFTDQIKGLPGSAGQAEGRVRIVNSPEEGDQLQPGEILVAVTTNVGWTPIVPRAAAVVTDVGAPLSHAAIVAREMGIPAVVGCGNATMLLKTGDHIRVDGGRGTVEILETKC